MTNSEIIKFLTSKTVNAGLVDKLKIKYRPIICPFIELLNFAKDKKSVFDFGCGSGQFCALIAKYTNVSSIMGIEINERLINNSKEVNKEFELTKDITFKTFDGVTIPDEISNYELIYMIDVFHHIPIEQQQQMMVQIFQKMGNNSQLIFKDIDAGSPFVIFNKLHDLVFAGEIGKEMSYKNAKLLLEKIGFTVTLHYKRTIFLYAHYFIVCEKKV